MKASVLDLRHRMADVLRALDRREQVTLTSHGKVRGVIVPAGTQQAMRVSEHPFFGMARDDTRPVDDVMADLREGRTRAV